MTDQQSQGLICPNCTAVIPVTEGARVVSCPACGFSSLIQGENGIRRWQVQRKVERNEAEKTVRSFFKGMNKAMDLANQAEIKHLFLIYLPYWRVQSAVAGWRFGRERKDKDETRAAEVSIMETMHWNDAAVDVSEYGVQRVTLNKEQLQPYNHDVLHGEAMVFEPAESATEALTEAEDYFTYKARQRGPLVTTFYEKFHFLQTQLSIVYYPLWVGRYEYKKRNYQVVVDGTNNKLLYGKAPGNIFYRAVMLVLGMAVGNFILINGSIVAFNILARASSSDDEGLFLLLLAPLVVAALIIFGGYSAFRYGEEVEHLPSENKKAPASQPAIANIPDNMQGFMKMGMQFLDELKE